MKRLLSAALLMAGAFSAYAQTGYDASLISKDLLPYASAVVRNQEVSIEVKDADNTIYHLREAVTVLNKNGDDLARVVVWYNKANQLRYVKGVVYNEFGKLAGKFSEKDFTDQNAANDYSLFEDSRVKHYLPSTGSYPYTVEYEVEIRSKQSLNFRDWRPNPYAGLAVEKSTFTFTCNPAFCIRYKEINLPVKATVGTNADGLKTYTWQVNNLKAMRDEPYSPIAETYQGRVVIAPETFKYEGISGKFTDWNELGRWTYDKLLTNRQTLPPETVQDIKALVAGIADPKEKARKVYEYMQKKTRYISVQVGIGGYQPFPAADVDKLGYGDCKALVNYTQALLKAADVPSWYCVVEAGSEKISLMPDFASMNQGNHVILCLPLKNDTTFLECTSQKIPFGFLSDFTDDRTVLACTSEGGKLMHTPTYTAAANLQQRKADFKIDDAGNLTGDIKTVYKGTQYDNLEELIDEPKTEQLKMLQQEYTAISNLDIERFAINQEKAVQPATTETVRLNAREYASANNGQLYFSLNPLNRLRRVPREVRNRTTPVYINRGYTDEDEIVYKLPAGYKPDMAPLNVEIDKPFGRFTAKTVLNGDKLVFKRSIRINDGTYGKELYTDLVDFYQTVYETDNYNVRLLKN